MKLERGWHIRRGYIKFDISSVCVCSFIGYFVFSVIAFENSFGNGASKRTFFSVIG